MNEIPDDIESRLTAAVSEFFARKFGGEYEGDVFIDLLRDAIRGERNRADMTDRIAYRLAYAALASIDAPRTGFHLQPAIEAIKQEYAAIRQGQAKEGESA